MRQYTPRRCSKHWLDGDCPAGVLAIMDNKGQTADRYTVFYAEVIKGHNGPWIGYRGMSECPSHPQGVGMYGELEAHHVASYRYAYKHHYCKWTDLPKAVQDCVRADLAAE